MTVNWLIDFFENVATDVTIAHPTAYIILSFGFFYYGLGINVAGREKHISRRVIPPFLQKILFLNRYSYF